MLLLDQMIDVAQFVPQSSEVIQKFYVINVSLRPKRSHDDITIVAMNTGTFNDQMSFLRMAGKLKRSVGKFYTSTL